MFVFAHTSVWVMASRRRPRNVHLLNHVIVGDEIGLWSTRLNGYVYCRVIQSLMADTYRVEGIDGDIKDVKLSRKRWRFLGVSAQRVWANLQATQDSHTLPTSSRDNSSRCRCSIRLRPPSRIDRIEPIITRCRRNRLQNRA